MNPGVREKERGYPFVGGAGRLFESEVINRFGIGREPTIEVDGFDFSLSGDFYLTNVVKCWTADNADPPSDAIKHCWNHLRPELEGRRIIVPMGRLAQVAVAKYYKGPAEIFRMIHPSAAQYKGKYHARLIQDAKNLSNVLSQ
jgi:uracil-DNA glycosylase family 4